MMPIRAELRDLYDDYAIALDDFDLSAWAGFFTDDCTYRIVSMENHRENLPLSTMLCEGIGMVRDRAASIQHASVFEPRVLRHLVSGVRVDEVVSGDAWKARANFAILESLSNRETHLLVVGRYLDHVVRRDGQLKLRERVCVYDNYRIPTSLVYPI
ncbi:aromatic-ring-hydroxylating dioxygenase subunit beta [Castellaniella sp. GW247-6E4]|uniref:aromatic-ring-hydroxylating dioxygenase subunit beta n=1 Tax=Castellaniella sp. GW247-6E4 TaxID=3140380 RepID=UPI0033156B81